MASSLFQVKSNKLSRLESKKSHSWWWDSHVNPKNSKWLQENLEEMDQYVKRMLKLIEEDADSFAKKAEMYYQKRPELVHLVEEFYRMYRSLAERYDHVTGELRKNISIDIQSQGSGISEIGSEPATGWPSPDQKLSRRKSGPRAAGFDVFLGSGGSSSDLNNKEGDESSTLDSDSESDASSLYNYSAQSANGDDQGFRRKITELEAELHEVKERLRMQQEEDANGFLKGTHNGNPKELLSKIAGYEEELRVSREKIQFSEEEIARLKMDIQKLKSLESTSDMHSGAEPNAQNGLKSMGVNLEEEKILALASQDRSDESEAEASDVGSNWIRTLQEELKTSREKLDVAQKEAAALRNEMESSASSVHRLQDQIGSAQKDVAVWKMRFERKEKDILKLQDRIERYKLNLSERNQEIRLLRETISNANQTLSDENIQLQAEIARLSKERAFMEDSLKEWDLRCQSLEEELRRAKAAKTEVENILRAEIEELKGKITERNLLVKELEKSLDTFQSRNDTLTKERDELQAELSSERDQMDKMDEHLRQLHMEHVVLITGAEEACKLVEEMRRRVKELENEVEKQHEVIKEGAEEKREVIRQLCFSLEHYRDGYHQLREAFTGHKRLPVVAS